MSTFITTRAKVLNLKKVDARSDMVVKVRPSDITKAKQSNSKCCALARACKRLEGVEFGYFFRTTAWLEYEGRIVRFVLPKTVQQQIVSFDSKGKMEAGTYTLLAPSKSEKLSAINKRSKKRPVHRNKRPNKFGAKSISRKVRTIMKVRTLTNPTGAYL